MLPDICTVSADTEVIRIWQDDINRVLKPTTVEQLYAEVYSQVREERGCSLQCLDLFIDEELNGFDTNDAIRKFGSWLRLKESMDDLTDFERDLLGTSGDYLLKHIEKELKPNKTYKMAVLTYLLSTDLTEVSWEVSRIAKGFLNFYLQNQFLLKDYTDLARSKNPGEYSLDRVTAHILKNPLKYLSNTSNDCFILSPDKTKFSLRDKYHQYWKNNDYRVLLNDRVHYMLKKYQRDRLTLR